MLPGYAARALAGAATSWLFWLAGAPDTLCWIMATLVGSLSTMWQMNRARVTIFDCGRAYDVLSFALGGLVSFALP